MKVKEFEKTRSYDGGRIIIWLKIQENQNNVTIYDGTTVLAKAKTEDRAIEKLGLLGIKRKGETMKKDIQYAVMNFDDPRREEIPFNAATDSEARLQARAVAKKYDIKNYSIIFYRSSDGCRGKIDS